MQYQIDPNTTLTVSSVHAGTIEVGDVITIPYYLTKWERFLVWVARPWKWPPIFVERRCEITAQID
jgi:hypothetical protein